MQGLCKGAVKEGGDQGEAGAWQFPTQYSARRTGGIYTGLPNASTQELEAALQVRREMSQRRERSERGESEPKKARLPGLPGFGRMQWGVIEQFDPSRDDAGEADDDMRGDLESRPPRKWSSLLPFMTNFVLRMRKVSPREKGLLHQEGTLEPRRKSCPCNLA